jgi:hypothetical protein
LAFGGSKVKRSVPVNIASSDRGSVLKKNADDEKPPFESGPMEGSSMKLIHGINGNA